MPLMATPRAWPKARKKEYMPTDQARWELVEEAWMAKARPAKSVPQPRPGTKLRNIHAAGLVLMSRR